MPYIEQDKREVLDSNIDALGRLLSFDGDLNYVLFALCKRFVPPSYNNYKNYIGEIVECSMEIRRRMLSEYEDEKIFKNGDVE